MKLVQVSAAAVINPSGVMIVVVGLGEDGLTYWRTIVNGIPGEWHGLGQPDG